MGGMMGGMMSGGGGKGGGGGGGGVGHGVGLANQAMHARYQQLGLGVPAGGETGADAAASGGSLTYGGPSTMEQQDTSQIPSESGGTGLEGMAAVGNLQNANPPQTDNSGGSSLGQLAQQQQNQGFSDATSGFNSGNSQPGGNFGGG